MGHEVVGTFWQVLHWGPLLALSVIFTVAAVTMKCNAMWWPPFYSIGGFINTFVFLTFVTLTLYNYFMAMIRGPGFIPYGWKPVSVLISFCSQPELSCMSLSLSELDARRVVGFQVVVFCETKRPLVKPEGVNLIVTP